jgi:hypothetical protein
LLYSKRPVWAAIAAAFVTLGSPAVARGDAVIDWNLHAVAVITGTTPAPTAHYSTLPFAMVHGAVYDAVNAIDGGHQAYLVAPVPNPLNSSEDAAAATAAYKVLSALYPARQAQLDGWYADSLALVSPGAAKTGGIAVGETAAAAMLAARANDGRFPTTPFPFVFGTTPGVWRVSFPSVNPEPTPWVGNVKTFLVPNAEMLRTKGPNALTSRAYAQDVNEVESLGSLTSTTRTADQTMAAIFWQSQPTFIWSGLMRTLSSRYSLSTADNARLFGMVALAQADASIGCWNDKYYWNLWRPIDAIRQADTDGNPATTADPNWLPLFDPITPTVPALVTPVFPEHPSGHMCLTSAVLTTMRHFFHSDKIAYDITSTRFAQTRHFDSFSENIDEILNARIWGGIHFRTADEQGATLGQEVAHYEQAHFFKAAGDEDDAGVDD